MAHLQVASCRPMPRPAIEGSPAVNQTLSKLRTQVAADDLVAQDLDRGRIVLRTKGAIWGDPGVESRRVASEIY